MIYNDIKKCKDEKNQKEKRNKLLKIYDVYLDEKYRGLLIWLKNFLIIKKRIV